MTALLEYIDPLCILFISAICKYFLPITDMAIIIGTDTELI